MPKTNQKNAGGFNFGRMAEDIMGFVMNAGTEGRERAKVEIEKMLDKMDLVNRREFDAVRDIAVAARAQAEELAEKLADKLHESPLCRWEALRKIFELRVVGAP